MPNDTLLLSEVLVTPLAQMVHQLAGAIAAAQTTLDAGAVERQRALEKEHPELHQIGYQVTWYQIPEVIVDLKMAVHYEETGEVGAKRRIVLVSPFNAKYSRSFSYAADGASTMKLRVVPVPPPVIMAP